jgi:hypothetical protein
VEKCDEHVLLQSKTNKNTKTNKYQDKKAYNTVSNEALCIITGLISINIKIEE